MASKRTRRLHCGLQTARHLFQSCSCGTQNGRRYVRARMASRSIRAFPSASIRISSKYQDASIETLQSKFFNRNSSIETLQYESHRNVSSESKKSLSAPDSPRPTVCQYGGPDVKPVSGSSSLMPSRFPGSQIIARRSLLTGPFSSDRGMQWVCSASLPVYSDRFAQVLHLIPSHSLRSLMSDICLDPSAVHSARQYSH